MTRHLAWFLSFLLAFQSIAFTLRSAPPPPSPLRTDKSTLPAAMLPHVQTPAIASLAASTHASAALPAAARIAASATPHHAGAADATDPYIMAQASALGYNAQNIFNFVRDSVGYEAYRGSLRGARGTLWSLAGNSLDRASLLIALLRASGFTARYAQGTLASGPAQQLILSMFKAPAGGILGCLPGGTTLGNPAADATLTSYATDHYWVQYQPVPAGSYTDMDTSQSASTIGATFAPLGSTFDEVPSHLQHIVKFTAKAETYSQAAAAFAAGNGLGTTKVLEQTFPAAELVGKPISFGHFVNTQSLGGLVFSSVTHTYSPYLVIGASTTSVSSDQVIRGADYQENLTSFPLGSQVLTGVFLDIETTAPGGTPQKYTKTIFDRIGYVLRHNGGGAVSTPAATTPAFSVYDTTTIDVAPSRQSQAQVIQFDNLASTTNAQLTSLQSQIGSSIPPNPTPQQQVLMTQALGLGRDFLIALGRMLTTGFAETSDRSSSQLANGYYVKAYHTSPRILIATTRLRSVGASSYRLDIGLDLLKDDIEAISPPNQSAKAPSGFHINRGINESTLEGILLKPLGSTAGSIPVAVPESAMDIFEAAKQQSIGTIVLGPSNSGDLNSLPFSAEARARMSAAIAGGNIVTVPARPPTLPSGPHIAWLESDMATGVTYGVLEDGSHGSIVEYGGLQGARAVELALSQQPFLFLAGFLTGYFAGVAIPLLVTGAGKFYDNTAALAQQILLDILQSPVVSFLMARYPAFAAGFQAGGAAAFAYQLLERDLEPPLPPVLYGLPDRYTPTPGGAAGVTASLAPDLIFSIPSGEASVPLAYRATIRNTGPSDDTFNLSFGANPSGFSLQSSINSILIPAGDERTIGVCVNPSGPLPAPGIAASFQLQVASASNGAINTSANQSFLTPTVKTIVLTAQPSSLATQPGVPVTTTLQAKSVGNVAATSTFSTLKDSQLSFTGLPASITLNPGEVVNQSITFTPSAGAPLGSSLFASITGVYGAANEFTATAFSVQLLPASAKAAQDGAQSALTLGRTDIATNLSGLSAAMGTLAGSCSEQAKATVLAHVDALILQMNAPFLSSFVSQLQAARTAIAGITCPAAASALDQLGAILTQLNLVLNSPAAYPFDFLLIPNTAVAQPGASSAFSVYLRNASGAAATYNLALGALPGGVSGSLSQSSITLNAGQAVTIPGTAPVITLMPSAGTAFSFDVTASIHGVSGSARTIQGQLTARTEFLNIVDVVPTPAYTNAGGSVSVVTRIANSVNQAKDVKVTLTVKNSSNVTVFTSSPVNATLSTQNYILPVNLGSLDTTGYANGTYTLHASVTDTNNQPIPGGAGTGTFLIGSPVTASLTTTPQTVAPGNSTVTSTLSVADISGGGGGGGGTFNLIGSVDFGGGGRTVSIRNNYAYVCGQQRIGIIDITTPSSPIYAQDFAQGDTVGSGNGCGLINNDYLFMVTGNGINGLIVYDLSTTPALPTFKAFPSTVNSLYPFITEFTVNGSYIWFSTAWFNYFGNNITAQHGEFFSYNLTDLTTPTFAGAVPFTSGNPTAADSNLSGRRKSVIANATTAIFGSTTANGSDALAGTGKLVIVDITNPAAPTALSQVLIPGTGIAMWLAISGNRLLVLSNTQNWNDPGVPNFNYSGNLVISVFDITDPRNPSLIQTTTTSIPNLYATATQISANQFVLEVSPPGPTPGDPSQLYLLDITNPSSPVITAGPQLPGIIGQGAFSGGLYYAATGAGLSIYQIGGGGSTTYTATLHLPKGGQVAYNSGSFNPAPTTLTSGASFDTAVWSNISAPAITFNSNITGMMPAQVLPVVNDATVNFVHTLGGGTITLPGTTVNSGQLLQLNPSTRTVAPGELASYTLTVKNPTASPITYSLGVTGLPAAWVSLQNAVTVAANSQTDLTLSLHSAIADVAGSYGFAVNATSGGASGSVLGTLILTGTGSIGALTSPTVLGVNTVILPASATGGQATPRDFVVRVTNTGNTADTYNLSASFPSGLSGVFSQPTVTVPPGVGNYRDVHLLVTATQGTPAGAKNFTAAATSTTSGSVAGAGSATLNLLSYGVTATLAPNPTAPGSTINLTVTNRGTVTDTFDLLLAGPGALISSLGLSSITLAPGASQNVPVVIGQASFATLGALLLQAGATSRGNATVAALASASITISPSKGVSANFKPSQIGLTSPGSTLFLLEVQNTGTLEDNYKAHITGTTGPITASLMTFDGSSSQSIPTFTLPGVTKGILVLNATLNAAQTATATVEIVSLSDGAVKSSAVATLGIGGTPIANAGKDRNIGVGKFVLLDGAASSDPDGNKLIFKWKLLSKPAASALNFDPGSTPYPGFRPDATGNYTFQLIVNNGSADSLPDTVVLSAFTGNIPPTADAGPTHTAQTAAEAELDGTLSHDNDHAPSPLSYQWSFVTLPQGSGLTNASIAAASNAKSSFRPDVPGEYTLQLQVSDGSATDTDTVVIRASSTNAPPNSRAGVDRRSLPNVKITLNGSQSFDPDHAPSPLTYSWSWVFGSLNNASLQAANTSQASFTPAMPGFYVAELKVSDGALTGIDNAGILVSNSCDANADGLVNASDFELMAALSGAIAQLNDPLDSNNDGVISSLDVDKCTPAAPVITPVERPQITIQPRSLTFLSQRGSAPPAAQLIEIGGDSNLALAFRPLVAWLRVTPERLETPTRARVTVDPSGMAPGIYDGDLLVTAPQGGASDSIRIRLTVIDPPKFFTVPEKLTFTYSMGSVPPASQRLFIYSTGRTVRFTATPGASWLSLTPNTGDAPAILDVAANPVNLPPGLHATQIQITSTDTVSGPLSVPVELNVLQPPPAFSAAQVRNSASLLSGSLAPGEIIVIDGSDFAAPNAAFTPPPGKAVPTILGTTRVLVNGTPAPLIYVQEKSLSLVTPFSIAGQTTIRIQIVRGGASSPEITLGGAPAAPGIFTTAGTGSGQAAAFLPDGARNDSTHPTTAGSLITVYFTGAGTLLPEVADGSLGTEPLSKPVLTLTAEVGGLPAEVSHVSSVPGLVHGLLLAHIKVPKDSPTGAAIPLTLRFGAISSQPGVTIAVQ